MLTCGSKTRDHVPDNGIIHEVVQPQPVRVLEFELVVIGKEAEEVHGGQHLCAIVGVLDVLHERRKEITVCEVGWQSRVKASRGYGESGSDSFASQGYCVLSVLAGGHVFLDIHVRPVRITVSRVAIKSVMTASASCKPARTEIMSELGFVYFFVKAASRKTAKVWPVSH